MKRKLRVLRIWYYGKLPYAKIYKLWTTKQLFLNVQIPDKNPYKSAYKDEYFEEWLKDFSTT